MECWKTFKRFDYRKKIIGRKSLFAWVKIDKNRQS